MSWKKRIPAEAEGGTTKANGWSYEPRWWGTGDSKLLSSLGHKIEHGRWDWRSREVSSLMEEITHLRWQAVCQSSLLPPQLPPHLLPPRPPHCPLGNCHTQLQRWELIGLSHRPFMLPVRDWLRAGHKTQLRPMRCKVFAKELKGWVWRKDLLVSSEGTPIRRSYLYFGSRG